MRDTYPVVIVGGGPVGMGLAIDLGQRGVECLVVERHSAPQRIPKGQNLTQRTMEHLAAWGVEEQIRNARVMPSDYPNSGVTAYRNLTSEWSYPWWQRSAVSAYYALPNERIPQYETERVLRERVAALPEVEVLYDWSGQGLLGGGRVRVVARRSGEERIVEARYLVGCDGSHSTIRRVAGIRENLSDHDRRMVLLVFRSRGLHEVASRFGEAAFFNIMHPGLDGYWRFLGRVDGEGHWFFHAPIPDGASDDIDFTALLHEAVGAEFEVEFDHIGFWDLRFATATSYRLGSVFLAGDAAHSHPPYGGYGINTGFEDARNLAWKLAARLEGWGSEELLGSYDAERRPVFESTSRDFIEKMITTGREFLERHDPDVDRADFSRAWEERKEKALMGVSDFEPHYEGSPIVFTPGVPSAVGSHVFTARPGHHLPPRSDVFGLLGTQFTLLAFDVSTEGFRSAASSSAIPLKVVEMAHEGEVTDYGSRLVLVRPDDYVAWVGDEAGPALADEVLGRAVGR